MPLLFACYILAYIDRINVGFAKLQMQQDLGMSDSVYGIGAGIFFIGYFFFEVPANILLQRLGAKYWLGSIMVVWGITSASTMFVHSAGFFYVLRFLLGVVESGFFPGVILYLTFWYPAHRRARMTAIFMTAIPLSGLVGGAISGWILEHMSTARRPSRMAVAVPHRRTAIRGCGLRGDRLPGERSVERALAHRGPEGAAGSAAPRRRTGQSLRRT